MKPFKLFSVQFRSLALSVGILLAFACGPGLFDENEFLSYFLPESSDAKPTDKLYFFTPKLYNVENGLDITSSDTLLADDNLTAWANYAGGIVPAKAIRSVLYKASELPSNPLISRLKATHPAAVDYLKLAHEADKAVVAGTDWNTEAHTDTIALRQLLTVAQLASQSATDPFLKERYAFQTVKLADEIGEYKQAVDLYDQLVKPLAKKTYISNWALSRHAGASLALGDTARAIYEFAQVFDRCPSRRRAAETSLRIHGLRFRDDALALAQTDGEKAAVLAICAIQPSQDALPMLEQIVAMTPGNPLVELIMSREINRNEYYFLETANPVYPYDEATKADSIDFEAKKKNAPTYREKLRDFALTAATNKALTIQHIGSAAFWYTAAAYLDYLAKDYAPARTNLDKAARLTSNNPSLKQQIALQNMLLLAAQTETITPDVETKLIGYLDQFGNSTNFRLTNAFVKVCTQFADLYRGKASETKSGGFLSGCSRPKANPVNGTNTAKAFLLTALTSADLNKSGAYFNTNTDLNTIEDTTAAATIKQVLTYASQPDQTDFDKRLLKLTAFNIDTLNLLLGRRYVAEHQYEPAAEAFRKVNPAIWKLEAFQLYFARNPFGVKMPGEPKNNPYTPVAFAQKMADLVEQAKTASGDKAADIYYQLGCGAYNLSWYGNAWLVRKAAWSFGELSLYNLSTDPAKREPVIQSFLTNDYFITARARAFFEQSAKAARTPALADRAAFMVARCEENAFMARRTAEEAKRGFAYDETGAFDKDMQQLRRTEYGTALIDFSKNHTKGRFNDEMLRECATYTDFLNFREGSINP